MKKNDGFVLVSLIITMTFLLMIGIIVAQLVIGNFTLARQEQYRINAQLAADSGIDFGITEINTDVDWAGTGGEITIFDNSDDLRVTVEVTVVPGSGSNEKTLTATGRVYSPSSATEHRSDRIVIADLRGLSGGDFSVVTGVGGLYMSNSAKIVGGNVHVNGEVTMQNSSQIGLTSNPVILNVGHYNCPSGGGPTYPQLCSSGEPISTSNSAHIYGDVCANNQVDGSDMTSDGLLVMGVDPDCLGSVAFMPLPLHDRMAQITNWENEGSSTLSSSAASCTTNGGSKVWPANVRITGDAEISKKCTVTAMGDVWIDGKLTMSNSAELLIADVLGTPLVSAESIPTIMIDGDEVSFSNSSKIIGNATDVGPMIITYKSANACTTIDDPTDPSYCPALTGDDLYNSRNTITINFDNSAEGPETIFFAKWSRVLVANSGEIGALVGQTVELKNSGAVTFGTTVPGSEPTVYIVDDYKRGF